MADRREFFQEVARAGGRRLIDVVGLALRVSEDPAGALDRLMGGTATGRKERAPAALPESPPFPAAAELWHWPDAPPPLALANAATGFLLGPATQQVRAREIPPRRVLFEDMPLPAGAWILLPAPLAALCRWEAPVHVVAVAGDEHLALEPRGRRLGDIRRLGVALGRGHEAWVQAACRERGLPEPEVVAAEPGALPALQHGGEVDAAVVEAADGRELPAWALAVPVAWSLPADWQSVLLPGWRVGPGSQLQWLCARLGALAPA